MINASEYLLNRKFDTFIYIIFIKGVCGGVGGGGVGLGQVRIL